MVVLAVGSIWPSMVGPVKTNSRLFLFMYAFFNKKQLD
jgi:hypothetical protein